MLVFGLLVSGTIMNIIIQSLGDNKKGQSGDQRRRKARAPAKLHEVHWLHELFKGLTVSQQRYFYPSFQINDESKCTEKSYQIFLTFNSHMYSRDTNLWRPKIWRLSFLSLPAPPLPPPPRRISMDSPLPMTQPPMGMIYDILWSRTWITYYQICNHRFDARKKVTKYVQKCPRNCTVNNRKSSFELKMG